MPSVSSQEGIHINKAQICPTSELLALSVTREKMYKNTSITSFQLECCRGQRGSVAMATQLVLWPGVTWHCCRGQRSTVTRMTPACRATELLSGT